MKIDKWFHLYGRKDDIVFEEVPFEELPSTEPEIIRCKDCFYYRRLTGNNNYCDHDFAGIRHVPFDDDYCSYAERKTDERLNQ